MAYSREQLVTRALNRLGVIGAGQTAAAEDSQLVDDTVNSVMGDLATRDIFTWGDPDQIDDDAFEHLAGLLAIANARAYGSAPDEQERLLLESRLRQLNLVFLSGQRQQAEYL